MLGSYRSEVSIKLSQVRASWGAHSNCSMRDLWQGRELGRVEGGAVSVSLALHDAALPRSRAAELIYISFAAFGSHSRGKST